MKISFEELCTLIAREKNLASDFWKEDPIYVSLNGSQAYEHAETIPFATHAGFTVALDVDKEDYALGIEIAPM